jgi:hypothetical protein
LFQYGLKNEQKNLFFGFAKQAKNQPKQIMFWFVAVRTKKFCCLFCGHPSFNVAFFVCFTTDLFVSVISKWVKNTETNQNKFFLVLRTNRNKQI